MPGQLLLDVGLLFLQRFDAVLDAVPLAAQLGVLFAERMLGGNLLPQRLLAFQQVRQSARTRGRVQQVPPLLVDGGRRLEQLAARRSQRQPVNVTGDFVTLRACRVPAAR